MLSFKPAFSLSSFTFIKRLLSSSLLSAIKVVSCEVIDISPAIFIPPVFYPPRHLAWCTVMGELDYKESWVLKNWWFWTVVLEKTLESPLYCKEIQPVHSKWNQSWIFIGRTDAKAEAPILWPPDTKNWLTGKGPGKRCWERLKAEGEEDNRGWEGWMASLTQWTWDWASSRTGKPGCCSPLGRKELDMTELMNWLNWLQYVGTKLLQSCPTLCRPKNCSLPAVQRILQARILEWVAISSSRGSSPPRDRIHVS